MTNTEILEAAIQKAIDGGWKQDLLWIHGNNKSPTATFMKWVSNLEVSGFEAYYDYDGYFNILELIFNHDFAKAIWNAPTMWESDFSQPCFETKDGLSEWQHHLQQMVISEDPIKYLGEHLNG